VAVRGGGRGRERCEAASGAVALCGRWINGGDGGEG
jgi:hypothetical protein